MAHPLTSPKYDKCRNWIRERMNNGWTLEKIRHGGKKGLEGLREFIRGMQDFDDWPADLNEDIWMRLADALEEERQRQIQIETMSVAAQIIEPSAINSVSVPVDKLSAWQRYRTHLLEDADFTPEAVRNVEVACARTMRLLSTETRPEEPRRGLIVGNVQSGKTANMSGLMAMAADAGINMFIILSGTIESLRLQTLERLFDDLSSPGRSCNLMWHSLEHPAKGGPPGERTQDLRLMDDSRMRYMTVCLKHVMRLEDLIAWLWEDPHQLSRMRILVIDDEADQASIDTAKISKDEERTSINRLILDLVYGPGRFGRAGSYGAMNYVSYTATPYANCLNEAGPGTLYPQDFIQTLAAPLSYFGPDKMFPTPYSEVDGTLETYREIPDEDRRIMCAIHSGEANDIPGSLQQALLWFFCACGVMRYHQYARPVSMLIHTSQIVDHHNAVADAVRRWITESRDHIVDWCRELYAIEQLRVTRASLRAIYPDYEHPDAKIWDYPEFDAIVPHIKDVAAEVSTILFDRETQELCYGRSVHLCVDNSTQNGIDGSGTHMRLAYPTNNQLRQMDFAPAFIVIGGNTLSRGLTLQGLVTSYFLRSVRQADTLMQMARWFGYRPHYELLPRIWMTQDTYDKFAVLATIDYDLRLQIRQMQELGQTPMQYTPAIMTSPMVTWLRLTSPAKMQSAVTASVDFAGTQTQLTVYDTHEDVLRGNLRCMEDFLAALGTPRKSELTAAFCWEGIPYADINEHLFKGGFRIAETSRVFQQLEFLNEWVVEQTAQGLLTTWTVIACGLEYTQDLTPPERTWNLPGGNRLCTVERTARSVTDTSVNIGVLANRRDCLADLRQEQVSTAQWDEMKRTPASQLNYSHFRKEAGVASTPLLLIYRIYSKSEPRPGSDRKGLGLSTDPVGLTMVCPGTRSKSGVQQRVRLDERFLNVEWEAETNAD